MNSAIKIIFAILISNTANAKPENETNRDMPDTIHDNAPLFPGEFPLLIDFRNLLTRRWRGVRTWFAENGMQILPVYKLEINKVLKNGTEQKAVGVGNFDLKILGNAEKLVGLNGVTFMFYGLLNHGHKPTNYIGDSQGTSNIETPTPGINTKIYEAWVQKAFNDEKGSVLVGLHDLNSEFYVTESSTTLLNASFGIGKEFSQTGENGPSIFPVTSTALRLQYLIGEFDVLVGAFDAVPGDLERPKGTRANWSKTEGLLLVSEIAKKAMGEGVLSSKIAVGAWRYTKKVDHLIDVDTDGFPTQDSSQGVYILYDHEFKKGRSYFIRLGHATSSVNRFASNLAAGFRFSEIVDSRPDDQLSLGITTAKVGDEYKSLTAMSGDQIEDNETTIELTYRADLGRGIALQPDFQYITNPDNSKVADDVAVGILRLQIDF